MTADYGDVPITPAWLQHDLDGRLGTLALLLRTKEQVCLYGPAGSGRRCLAAALKNSLLFHECCKNGVLWIRAPTVKSHENPERAWHRLLQLMIQLLPDVPEVPVAKGAMSDCTDFLRSAVARDIFRLKQMTRGKHFLIVLLDASHQHQFLLEQLQVTFPSLRLLVISNERIDGTECMELVTLPTSTCSELLQCILQERMEQLTPFIIPVLQCCEGSPYFLTLLARGVSALLDISSTYSQDPYGDASTIFGRCISCPTGISDRFTAVVRSLLPEVLSPQELVAFRSLCVFPTERVHPVAIIHKYWEWCENIVVALHGLDHEKTLQKLRDLGLIRWAEEHDGSLTGPVFTIPAPLKKYLCGVAKDTLTWHQRLVDYYASLCSAPGAWETVFDDGYFYQNFEHHCEALNMQPPTGDQWYMALLPAMGLIGLELCGILEALPHAQSRQLVRVMCFLAMASPSWQDRIRSERALNCCFGVPAVYEEIITLLQESHGPGDLVVLLRCMPNLAGSCVDHMGKVMCLGAQSEYLSVQLMARHVVQRCYDPELLYQGLTAALELPQLYVTPEIISRVVNYFTLPFGHTTVPHKCLSLLVQLATGQCQGPACTAAQTALQSCTGMLALYDLLCPLIMGGGGSLPALRTMALHCLPSLSDLASTGLVDLVIQWAFNAQDLNRQCAAQQLLARSPGRQYIASSISRFVEKYLAEVPEDIEPTLRCVLSSLPPGSANDISASVALLLLKVAAAQPADAPATGLAASAQALLRSTPDAQVLYSTLESRLHSYDTSKENAQEASSQQQVLILLRHCLDLACHPPKNGHLRILFGLATSDSDSEIQVEAQGLLRQVSVDHPAALGELFQLVTAALPKAIAQKIAEGPRCLMEVMRCVACLSTLSMAPDDLIHQIVTLYKEDRWSSLTLKAIASRLLRTCEKSAYVWEQLMVSNPEDLPDKELHALLNALPVKDASPDVIKLFVHVACHHQQESIRLEARALLPHVGNQSLVAQLLRPIFLTFKPQTHAEAFCTDPLGHFLRPDTVLQNACLAWPRDHIAVTISLDTLEQVIQLALFAPMDMTASSAQSVLTRCAMIPYLYDRLAAHLSVGGSTTGLLMRILKSFPPVKAAGTQVLDKLWDVACNHYWQPACEEAQRLLRECSGNLYVYRMLRRVLEMSEDEHAGQVSSDVLLAALRCFPSLCTADDQSFHTVLLMAQSTYPDVKMAARDLFLEAGDIDGTTAVFHICIQLTTVLRGLGSLLDLRPRSHIFGHKMEPTAPQPPPAFHPAEQPAKGLMLLHRQRMQRTGTDRGEYILNILRCYPQIPDDAAVDDAVAMLIDLAVLAKDDDVKRESARMLRECKMPNPSVCSNLLSLLSPQPQDYCVADILRAIPDLSLATKATVDMICGWYNYFDCEVREECHALLRRSDTAPLVYDWFDRMITSDIPDADLMLLTEAMPNVLNAPLALQDKLVCLTEEPRDNAVLRKLTTCLAPLLAD